MTIGKGFTGFAKGIISTSRHGYFASLPTTFYFMKRWKLITASEELRSDGRLES
jgi:hypothetical protein